MRAWMSIGSPGSKQDFSAINPIQTRGGGLGGEALEPAPTLKIRNFQTVKAMTTKFGYFC